MRRRRSAVVGLCLGLGLSSCVGCASAGPSARSLHYVDGALVHSRPPHARAYEAYLRARLALDSEPPRIEEAREHIEIAIHYHPRDPHLWTTRAQIEAEAGDVDRALASAGRALELRPDYAPAVRLVAALDGQSGPASASIDRREATTMHP